MTADPLAQPGFTQALTQDHNSKYAEMQTRGFFYVAEFIRVEFS